LSDSPQPAAAETPGGRLFGTDGIRGQAGIAPLDAVTIQRVGAALVRVLTTRQPRLLIGGDTRESFSWIERELSRGMASQGATVVSVGVTPTPGVAYLTRLEEFDAGVVISASHNPFQDNGIKIFSSRGEKLDHTDERRIEAEVADTSWTLDLPAAADEHQESQGSPADYQPELRLHYCDLLLKILPYRPPLTPGRVVLDCANGATQSIASDIFRRLDFDLVMIGDQPDGRNINLQCGSTHLELLQRTVLETQARCGVAFDGDGDRALFVDHQGKIVDGDALLYIAARQLQHQQRLAGNIVVATVMSNIGLELALKAHGIRLLRAPVGDKYVMEQMQAHGAVLGGEQSGHIIFADHLMTGDGLATALHILRIIESTGQELASLASDLVTYPQVLVNVRVGHRADYLQVPAIAEVIKRVQEHIDGQGRLLIRYSGTEPLLRIMIEGKDDEEIRRWADEIAEVVTAHLG